MNLKFVEGVFMPHCEVLRSALIWRNCKPTKLWYGTHVLLLYLNYQSFVLVH